MQENIDEIIEVTRKKFHDVIDNTPYREWQAANHSLNLPGGDIIAQEIYYYFLDNKLIAISIFNEIGNNEEFKYYLVT